MFGFAVFLAVYVLLGLAVIPAAYARARKVSLAHVYAHPAAVRREWAIRAPAPWLLAAAWYIAPGFAFLGTELDRRIPLLLHPERAALIETAATNAGVEFDAEKRKALAEIEAHVERAKTQTWLAIPAERLAEQRADAIARVEAEYSPVARAARQEAGRKAAYAEYFPAVRVDARLQAFHSFWRWTWLIAVWWGIRSWRRNRSRAGFHGFARWSRWREVIFAEKHRWLIPMWVHHHSTRRAWPLWERYCGTVGLAVFAPPEGDAVCSHYLLLGATGSGKGAAVFSHIMATSRTPVIYQDEKGECPMIDTPRWRNAIRWGCAADGGWPSMSWNPIEECRRDDDPENAFLNLAAVLIPDAEGENAWIPKLTRPILADMLMSGRWPTLADFADEVKGRAFPEIAEAVRMQAGLRGALEGRNVKEYLVTTLFSELEPFRVSWGRAVTNMHHFTLDDLIGRGGYVLGAETEEARRAPIKLLWALLLRKLMRSTQSPPLVLLMDEARKAGKIPHFADALLTLRNRGVCIWSAWQSESQIVALYGREQGESIIDGFGNRLTLLHGISVRDAEALAKASGNWSKKRGGHMNFGLPSFSLGPGGPSLSGPSLGYTTGGSDETAMPLITATDILNRSRSLEDRWAIISARGGSRRGNLIVARMMSGGVWSRTPTAAEIATATPPPPLPTRS